MIPHLKSILLYISHMTKTKKRNVLKNSKPNITEIKILHVDI